MGALCSKDNDGVQLPRVRAAVQTPASQPMRTAEHSVAQRPCSIPRTEERAITLQQLREVIRETQARWDRWGVRDRRMQLPVQSVEEINLYAVKAHLIVPQTEPFQCAYVELVAQRPQPPRWFVSHW